MTSRIFLKNELVSLTYGCIVRQIIEDCENDIATANKELETLGFNIGGRLIDEFLSRQELEPCKSFKEVAEKIILGFKMFLGVDVKLNQKSDTEFSYIFTDNTLDTNVVLPDEFEALEYSNIICGVIRGALNAINLKVKCYFVSDRLQKGKTSSAGPSQYEIKVELEEVIKKKLINYDD